MTPQCFVIQGNPRGQGRPRAFVRGRHAGVYKAKQDSQNEDNIRSQIVAQHPEYIQTGAIALGAVFYMPRPKYHYNSKGEVKPRYADDKPIGRPDLDNLLKALKDAFNGVVWRDDSQVIKCTAEKRYAAGTPHIAVEVY